MVSYIEVLLVTGGALDSNYPRRQTEAVLKAVQDSSDDVLMPEGEDQRQDWNISISVQR